MSNISISIARTNGDLALSALVSMAGLVVNLAIVSLGVLIV